MFEFQSDKSFYTVKAENRQFEEAVDFINEVLKLHISRTPQIAGKQLKKVQIAGTNGKGSTAAMLSAILQDAGYKTGLYTSPSLICVNERIRLNGEMIPDSCLESYIPVISQAQENTGRLFGGFERITAASMLYYLDNNVDIAVMETGLGGRYDTVSAVEHLILASITAIGMDHTVMLGNTIEQIAWEKCGIMRSGAATVCHSQQQNAQSVIENCAKEIGSQLIKTSSCEIISAQHFGNYQSIKIGAFNEEYDLRINLMGEYQRENAKNALLCALSLRSMGYNISRENIEHGFANARWQGRMERISIDGIKSHIYIDGAHNPHAMKAAAGYAKILSPNKKSVVVLSVMADKDIDGILENVASFAQKAVCVAITDRSCTPATLAKKCKDHGIEAVCAQNVMQALKLADDMTNGDDFFALGSLYLVGKVLEIKQNHCK